MRKMVLAVIILGLISNGCSFASGDKETQATTTTQGHAVQMEEPASPNAPEPSKNTKSKAQVSKKSAKGNKSEAQIKAELDQMGKKLVAQSARTLLPNINHKNVSKIGGSWVATYMHVNTENVSTEMRPSKNGQYVGFIRYREEVMECRGASKEAALKAPCEMTKTRNLTELIHYDGSQWQD